jgi:hypothetical protein
VSYGSTSTVSKAATLASVRDLVLLLGYKQVGGGPRGPERTESYVWLDREDYRSFTGVELSIDRDAAGQITVSTRSSSARSHWDLVHQNKTLKLIKDFAGGQFTTDAGKNRYWRPDAIPPSPLEMGCYLARWRFHNALILANIYRDFRGLDVPIAKDGPSGFYFMDQMNPRLLSNNMMLPYAVAIWEDYFRSTYAAVLRYSGQREAAIKRERGRITAAQLDQVANGYLTMDEAVAESLSFQHPAAIIENFKALAAHIDIGSAFQKPYRRRKQSLRESVTALIECRNEFVHTGRMSHTLFDAELVKALKDLEVVVDRCYERLAKTYSFKLGHAHLF